MLRPNRVIYTATATVAMLLLGVVLPISSSSRAQQALELDETLTPSPWAPAARVFLPYIAKMATSLAPPTPTPTSTPTPSPTSTSTATKPPTPTPTVTPTPTPTLATIQVEVLPNHSHYIDNLGSLRIVGEVQNNTHQHLHSVRITTKLFDSEGQVRGDESSYTKLDVLPPGDKTCFDVLFWIEPADWSYYEFEVQYRYGGTPPPDLSVLNKHGSYDSNSGWYVIDGEVRNDAGLRIEYVRPVGTVYDASGTAVGCKYTYVDTVHLDPGQTSPFELIFRDQDYRHVDSYRVQIGGNPSPVPDTTPSPTATRPVPATPTPTQTSAVTPTKTSTPVLGRTSTPTRTATPTSTYTHTPISTIGHTPTPTRTISPTSTYTPAVTTTPTPSSTSTPTKTGTPTSTYTLTPTATITPSSSIRITFVQYSGRDEYVQIANNGTAAQNMADWSILSVVGNQRYMFSTGYVLDPGTSIRVHSGPNAVSNPPTDPLWSTTYIWDDDGDEAELYDSTGRLVDSRCYKAGCQSNP